MRDIELMVLVSPKKKTGQLTLCLPLMPRESQLKKQQQKQQQLFS
jgi:hypothetical protein